MPHNWKAIEKMPEPEASVFDADVVVVGAGPVGLAAGLLLARSGLSSVILERHAQRSHHPKARGIRLRASELLKLWGFDAELRQIAAPSEIHRFIYVDTLAGEEIARTKPAVGNFGEWSAAALYRVPQDQLERVLEQRVLTEQGSTLRTGQTVVALDQDEDGVTVVAETADGGRATTRARYAIVADGVGSRLRGQLGIGFGQPGATPYWQSVYWTGDVGELTADRPAIMYFTQTGGDTLVGLAPAGGAHRWVTIIQRPPSEERPAPLTVAEAEAVMRRAIGRDDQRLEVLDSATFKISADVAEAYRKGRVFLAGDAAHSLPPSGGFGINTGLADVHNLVWKLEWVLRGLAPESLLDSYERERKAVAESNAAWSTVNAKRMVGLKVAMGKNDRDEIRRLVDEQSSHLEPIEQDLGFLYRPSDGGDTAPHEAPAYERLTVGARAPHALLEGGLSTLELFENRLTLVTAPGSAWRAAGDACTERPALQLLTVGEAPLLGVGAQLRERYPFGDGGAVLVRPDGHVAWQARDDAGASAQALAEVIERVANGALIAASV